MKSRKEVMGKEERSRRYRSERKVVGWLMNFC